MSWIRREPVESPPQLDAMVALLTDLGGILMGIDAKLETIVALMEDEDGDGD